jgi:hypothetical protein
MTWAIDATSIGNWATANASNKGPAFLWWEKAEALGDALATWWEEWYNDLGTPITNGTNNGALQMTTGGSSVDTLVSEEFACNVDGGATWTDGGTDSDASKTACSTACFSATEAALLVDVGSDLGGKTVPTYTGAGTGWCGGWSFNNVPTDHHNGEGKCKLLLNAEWDTANTNGATVAI